MFWADRIAKEIEQTDTAKKATPEKPLIIRDEKTISGRVHIGSMRGVAIHGLLSEVLNEKKIPNKFLYELNDFDVFDTVPSYLSQEKFAPYIGMMVCDVPSPEKDFENYAEYFGAEFAAVCKKAGFFPEYYRSTELYRSGKMDDYIRIALNHADTVRRIYKEVSGSIKNDQWLPLSVICENCKKVMTVRVSDWNGETVAYACDINPDGAKSCGQNGRVSPFGGTAKLTWKVEWAAKWIAMEVDVEGAGKDHSTKGGSRDVANHIAREVFSHEPPFDVPYEFFLVGGKKMSSSKGKGSSAKEMSDLFPAEILRLVLIGKDINQQIDVDPEGDSVPRTFDWFDDLSERLRAEEIQNDDFARLFELCTIPENRIPFVNPWQLRFSLVSTIVQMPHLSLLEEAAKVKESCLTEAETTVLFERANYAKFWLATYAPEQYRYVIQSNIPEVILSDTQKKALASLALYLQTEKHSGEEIHSRLHQLKTEIPIQPKELFSALYKIFLARDSGPKAGWFLSVLPQELVVQRLLEASA